MARLLLTVIRKSVTKWGDELPEDIRNKFLCAVGFLRADLSSSHKLKNPLSLVKLALRP